MFQLLINELLSSHIGVDAAIYLDDVLLCGATEQYLLQTFKRTLQRLMAANLRCKPRNCQLFPSIVSYLGYVLLKGEIKREVQKLEKSRRWPFPITRTKILAFLGL